GLEDFPQQSREISSTGVILRSHKVENEGGGCCYRLLAFACCSRLSNLQQCQKLPAAAVDCCLLLQIVGTAVRREMAAKTAAVLKTAVRCCGLLLAAADCRGCSSPEDGCENYSGTQDCGSPENDRKNLQQYSRKLQ
ncbi:unnamed protein product, partial [Musa acuminata subsp. burmannicoides]